MRIHRPHGRLILLGRRVDDAVGQRELVRHAELRRAHGEAGVQRDDLSLVQHGGDQQRRVFVAVLLTLPPLQATHRSEDSGEEWIALNRTGRHTRRVGLPSGRQAIAFGNDIVLTRGVSADDEPIVEGWSLP